MQKCNKDNKYPDENILRRFIRDAATCLQGLVGSESISHSDFIIAATKICDTLPILQDPRPASFPPAKKFPYWVGHLFMIYIFLNFLSLCFRTNDWHSEGNSCHYSYLFSVISITIIIIVYLHTFVYKFCCVRAMPIWLVDNRCITINVLQLPVHYPLHAEEAYSESTRIPKKGK